MKKLYICTITRIIMKTVLTILSCVFCFVNVISAQDNSINYTGTYTDKFGNTITLDGAKSGGAIIFNISVATESGCTGMLADTAYLSSPTAADYSDKVNSKCFLHFSLDKNFVEITEYDCEYYHGERCDFSGTYNKTK